jgi:general secretion pathway protein M
MTLSPAASRTAALALLGLVVMLLFVYLLSPLYKFYSGKMAQIATLQDRLYRYEQLLAMEPEINEKKAIIDAINADSDLFLKGNKVAIASANLREFVDEAVTAAGGQLISSQGYAAQPVPSATPVGLQLQISGEVRNLVDLLHALEDSRPLIFIDDFTVTSSAAREGISRGDRRAKASRGRSGSLDVRMNIVGFLPGEQP